MKLLVGINKITIDEKSKLNAGEYNIHEVEFEFDEVYNGLITKAVFEGNGHSYLIDIVNNKCTIPYEVLSEKGDITIGAYGYNIDGNDLVLRYSPSPIYTYVDLGSYRDSYDNYQQPTADIIEQLTNRIETAESQINEALEEVEGYNDRITTNTNNIDNLDNNKVDKIEGKGLSSNDYTNEEKTKLEGIETNAEVNIIEDIKVNNTSQSINNKSVNISIPTKTSDITNDSGFIDNSVNNLMNYTKSSDLATVATSGSYNDLSNKPTIPDVSSFITKDVNNLTNYTLKTNTGSLIDLEINNTTYVVTLSLKDIDGNVISTDTVDLPLENVVVSGRYDNNTKKVILTLENGSEVDFSVADLVADLQTEITSTNKLASDLVDDSNSGNKFTNTSEKATWNAKYDKPISGIPKSDLTNDVQSSLNLADSALQSFTETDPIFSNSASAGITSNDISKWNNKQNTLIAGTNITIDNDGKTISATDTTYSEATTSTSGLMSASDKTKLNGIETEANKTIVDNAFNSSSTNPLQNKVITDFIGTNATVTGTGTEFNLSNCLNKKLKSFKGYGDTKQDSLTGRNLLNTPYNENNKLSITSTKDDYVTITDYYAYLEANKTYTFSCESDGEAGTVAGSDTIEIFLLKDKGYDKYYFQHNAKTFTFLNTVAGNYYIRLDVNKGNVTHQFWNFYIAEENSFSGYEPYCGGIPAPNPDYPVDINAVTGRQVVKFNSKNLLEIIDGTASLNGMSLTRKNGVMIFDGTNTNQYQGQYISMNLTLTEKMTFNANPKTELNNKIKFFCSYIPNGKSTNSYISVNDGRTFEVGDFIKQFYIIIDANTTVNNYVIRPQLESGSTATSYVPYQHEEHEINLGKNLFDKDTAQSGTFYNTSNGSIVSSSAWSQSEYIPFNSDTTFTISSTYLENNSSFELTQFDENKQWITSRQFSLTSGSWTETTESNTKYIKVGFRNDRNAELNIQLERGSSASSYSPYFTPIKLYENEYIYKSNENWYIHRLWNEIVLDGSESDWDNWQVSNSTSQTYLGVKLLSISDIKDVSNSDNNQYTYCNLLTSSGQSNLYENEMEGIGTTSKNLYFKVLKTIASTLTGFKTWLSSNNAKVLYQLATPTEEQITNTELISQLNAIQPLLGDNIITIDTANELTMSLDIEAYTNTLSGKLEYLLDNV